MLLFSCANELSPGSDSNPNKSVVSTTTTDDFLDQPETKNEDPAVENVVIVNQETEDQQDAVVEDGVSDDSDDAITEDENEEENKDKDKDKDKDNNGNHYGWYKDSNNGRDKK